jgi:hypothetical protein
MSWRIEPVSRPLGQRFREYSGMDRDRIVLELDVLRDPRSGASRDADRDERIADLTIRLLNDLLVSEDRARVDH